MNKKGQKMSPLLLVGIGVAVLFLTGILSLDQLGLGDGVTAADDVTEVVVTSCGNEDITFTPSALRAGVAGTASTDGHRLFLGTADKATLETGINKGLIADSASQTVPVDKDFVLLFNENSTTYYTSILEGNSDCTDPLDVQERNSPQIETSLTFTYFNTDGTAGSNTTGVGAAAVDADLGSIKYKPSTNDFYGNPFAESDNIVVIEYNTSHYTSIEIEGAQRASIPGTYSPTEGAVSGTDAFFVPKVGRGTAAQALGIAEEATLVFIGDTHATNAPRNQDNPLVTFHDVDFDLDADTLALIEGVEDEDDNDIGDTGSQTDLINVQS